MYKSVWQDVLEWKCWRQGATVCFIYADLCYTTKDLIVSDSRFFNTCLINIRSYPIVWFSFWPFFSPWSSRKSRLALWESSWRWKWTDKCRWFLVSIFSLCDYSVGIRYFLYFLSTDFIMHNANTEIGQQGVREEWLGPLLSCDWSVLTHEAISLVEARNR